MTKHLGAIVIPVLNEAQGIVVTLQRLQPLRAQWLVIVVDGGSSDTTVANAKPWADKVIEAPKGRASQLNAGANQVREQLDDAAILVFLHADTLLPDSFQTEMQGFIESEYAWGRFDVALSGSKPIFRLIETMINGRSRLTGIATGDQALFYRANSFWQLGGFPDLPLMEDVEMSKRAKVLSLPFCSKARVQTSSRKWEQEGAWKTIVLMWWCRAAYFFGVSAARIHRWYYR